MLAGILRKKRVDFCGATLYNKDPLASTSSLFYLLPMPSDYELIASAIRYLDRNFQAQPSLNDLAAHLGLSPYHLQRLFKRWAGISPKRFLQYLTLDYARQLLQESHSVLATTYAVGLSSPSRLHDLFVTAEAMTPGEVRRRAAGLQITYGFHDTPFGECLLATTERGICALHFVDAGGRHETLQQVQKRWALASWREAPELTQPLIDTIFPVQPDGERRITLLLQGTNFQIKVWEALLAIPSGQVASYEDVAGLSGNRAAVRAAASALARNDIAYLIPCHRVLRKTGVSGQYRWGAVRKKAILAWEAARREQAGFDYSTTK